MTSVTPFLWDKSFLIYSLLRCRFPARIFTFWHLHLNPLLQILPKIPHNLGPLSYSFWHNISMVYFYATWLAALQYTPRKVHMVLFCCSMLFVAFTHNLQGWFTGTGAIIWSQCQWTNPEGLWLTLTYWGWYKMAAISQTTLSNAFSWMKVLELWLNFHWSSFLCVQLTIIQHWFR